MSRRDLSIEGLSRWRYRELKYYCLQYPEWREKIRSMTYIKSVKISDMPKSSKIENVTEKIILKKIELEQKCKIIEQTAKEVGFSIYKELIANVTEGVSYYNLNVPCGKEYFYKVRRDFFLKLSEKI